MEKYIGENLGLITALLIICYFLSLFIAEFPPKLRQLTRSDFSNPCIAKNESIEKEGEVSSVIKARTNLGVQFGAPLDFLKKYHQDFFINGRWINEEIFHIYELEMYHACLVHAYYFNDGILVRYTIKYIYVNHEGPLMTDTELKGNKLYDNINGVVLHEIDIEAIRQKYKDEEERIDRISSE
jgi:hypothetical protein